MSAYPEVIVAASWIAKPGARWFCQRSLIVLGIFVGGSKFRETDIRWSNIYWFPETDVRWSDIEYCVSFFESPEIQSIFLEQCYDKLTIKNIQQ